MLMKSFRGRTCPPSSKSGTSPASKREGASSPQRLSTRGNRIDLYFRAFDDFRRQRSVLQVLRERFAVMDSPPQKIDNRLALSCVLLIFVGENVGKAGDGVSVSSVRVGNRNSQI